MGIEADTFQKFGHAGGYRVVDRETLEGRCSTRRGRDDGTAEECTEPSQDAETIQTP